MTGGFFRFMELDPEDLDLPCVVEIRDNVTGEVRQDTSHRYRGPFVWEEGNFACDCNRALFFARAIGEDDPDRQCGDDAYSVRILGEDGIGEPSERDFEWVLGADGKARRVKSRLCCRFDGISWELVGVRSIIAAQAKQEVIVYAESSGISFEQVLQAVRHVVQTGEVWQAQSTGGQGSVCAPEVLLSFLLDYESTCEASIFDCSFTQARGTDDSGYLRILRIEDHDFGASCERRSDGQFANEPAASLFALSLILAQYAEADRQIAEASYAEAIPLLIKGEDTRVAKLRALGNAIDPRPAAAFIRATLDY